MVVQGYGSNEKTIKELIMSKDREFDSIKDSGESPSNSEMKGMDDQDIMNIVVNCDDFTDNDSDFFEAFTKGVFEHFGWTYLHKENIDDERFGVIGISESLGKLMEDRKQDILGQLEEIVKKDWESNNG
jgi:hypothetical protein